MPTIDVINVSSPNDHLGDRIRDAFIKCNNNFANLNSAIPSGSSTITQEVKAGSSLTKGQPVYISSANGTNAIVSKSSNDTEVTSSKTLGLITTNLAVNGFGSVITDGVLGGLNTSSASAGDPVWLGVNGNLLYGIANKPVAPAHMVFIGIVIRANPSNGEIFVKVQNGFELDELHNVQITSPQNRNVLQYSSIDGLWHNVTPIQAISNDYVKNIYKTNSATTTGGTTANTILKIIPIPANTFSANNDQIDITYFAHKYNSFGTGSISLWLNTASNLSGATQIAVYNITSQFVWSQILKRTFYIYNGFLRGYLFNNSSTDGMDAIGTSVYSSVAFDVTQQYYILACMQVSNVSDLINFDSIRITN